VDVSEWTQDHILKSGRGLSSTSSAICPKRYLGVTGCGSHRSSLDETGEERLLGFLEEHKYDTVVWYPRRPVASIHLGLRPDHWVRGRQSMHFVPNRLELALESDVLSQPGWVTHLRRVWRDMSNYVRPFYGDVRVLHGFYRGRGTYGVGADTEEHPVRVPWNGVPRTLGMALVVGEPYTRLWPGIAQFGEEVDGLRFVDSVD
jgi:hypothetical protein